MLTKDSFCRLCSASAERCEHYDCLAGKNHEWVHSHSETGNLLRLNEEITKWQGRFYFSLGANFFLFLVIVCFAVEYITRP
jgi:hypothetical protein